MGEETVERTMTWEEYYAAVPEPVGLAASVARVEKFVALQAAAGRRVVLVTSGGTTVPLERNMVRFVDNFSAGTRGAASAEYFVEMGYAVVFLHRQFSLQPYSRSYTHATHGFLDLLDEVVLPGSLQPNINNDINNVDVDGSIPATRNPRETMLTVLPEASAQMKRIFRRYSYARHNSLLHIETFVTVTDYLFTLKAFCEVMASLDYNAMFYLAAAVSDFFVPPERMAQHKIESQLGAGLSLKLDPVPKILLPLVKLWCPNAYTVSFKLETDDALLIPKARKALRSYGHQLVIANMLHTRKAKVTMVERDTTLVHHRRDSIPLLNSPSTAAVLSPLDHRAAETGSLTDITMTDQELAQNIEIESKIIPFVIGRHTDWIASGRNDD